MSLAVLDRKGRTVAVLSPGRVALAVAEIFSVATMVCTVIAMAPDQPLWPAALVIVTAAVAITLPDSGAGLCTLLGYGVWWLAAGGDGPWPWAVVGSIAGLVFHVALAHAASAPSAAITEPTAARALIGAAAVVALATAAVGALVAIITKSGLETPALLIGVALAAVALAPWAASAGGTAD